MNRRPALAWSLSKIGVGRRMKPSAASRVMRLHPRTGSDRKGSSWAVDFGGRGASGLVQQRNSQIQAACAF